VKLSLSGRLFEVDYRYCELSIEDFVALAKDIGYRGVELRRTQVSPDTPPEEVARTGRTVERAGLEVTCITARGVSLRDRETFGLFRRYVDLARALGCKLMKVGGEVPWLRKAADYAAGYGITLAANIHIRTPFETVSSALECLREVGRSNYRLIYDPAHLFVAGEEYGPGAIRKLADHICYVAVQCPKKVSPKQGSLFYKGFAYGQGLPGEEGTPDLASVFRGLRQIGYGGWVSVVEPKREGMDGRQLARLFYERLIRTIEASETPEEKT